MKLSFSISLVFLFMSLSFSSCSDIKPVKSGSVQEITIDKMSNKGVSLKVAIPIKNENNFQFKIKEIDIAISMSGTNLGTIKEVDKVLVKANSNDVHHFLLEIEFSKMLNGSMALMQLFLKSRAEVEMKGYIKVGKFLINKKIKVDDKEHVDLKKIGGGLF